MAAVIQANPPVRVRLSDYRAPPFIIDAIALDFDIDPARTTVRSTMRVRRNAAATSVRAPLTLHGRELELRAVAVDGVSLPPEMCQLDAESLSLDVPDACEVSIETVIHPERNASGLGMFVAGGVIATHCEAEGFRKITYFPDRPDVLTTYTVTLRADRRRYPVLLGNGNPVTRGEDGERHWVTWEDAHPKPSYLFAVVAGDLGRLADCYVTRSGRRVDLGIYASQDQVSLCRHAMDSLKRAMRWDEQEYGLECDLDVYNIVALNEFAGAQENKGLNVFDAQTIVAHPDFATDDDYMLIERIVGHEYFHNWTGNRVTCRDWFQLSLKEGLTRFRDQEFSRAMSAPEEKRIEAVRKLRADQFAEDAGPGAHPVKPESFIEIGNFYTTTVYDKGAEIIRMLWMLLGRDAFLRGVALYLKRHDGQAVTTEDFVRALEEAAGRDLSQMRLWYHQAGTPRLRIEGRYDAKRSEYVLEVTQSCPPTPGQPQKEPLHIPLAVGLLGKDGGELPLRMAGEQKAASAVTRVLEVRQGTQAFTFVGVPRPPVPSLLRGFSAPVYLDVDRSDLDAAFLMRHDTDGVSRWDCAQLLATRTILGLARDLRPNGAPELPEGFVSACGAVLRDRSDPGLAALLLTLPEENVLGAAMEIVDLDALAVARAATVGCLARVLRGDWLDAWRELAMEGPYRPDAESIGRRRLRNLALGYLAALREPEFLGMCLQQVADAGSATDRLAALSVLAHIDCAERIDGLARFEARWCHQPLLFNKWLNVQATSRLAGTVERVRALMGHPRFDIRNAAQGMALVGGFCRRNYVQFHEPGGSGYRFLTEVVLAVDKLKPDGTHWLMPQIMQWRRFDAGRQALMRAELEKMAGTPGISRGLYETVTSALGGGS
jgi:aminopeptidase N